MNASNHVSKYLSSTTQAAFKAKASADEGADTTEVKPKIPPTAEVALLRRIRKVVFGPSVKDIETALDRFNTIVESLDDSEENDEKKQPTKPADDK
jgi:hypothetical protein